MKTVNLFEVVKSRTNETIAKSKATFSTKQWFVDNLLNNKMTKSDIISAITVARIEKFNPDYKSLSQDELVKLIDDTNVTSKNGVESTVANSQNNAAFSYDPAYKNYELIRYGSLAYEVRLRNED